MEKLRVGIILEPGYAPSVGGGFAYYDTMVQCIDAYSFDERLDVVFLNFNKESKGTYQKPVLYINPLKYYTRKDQKKEKLIGYLGKPFFKSIRYFKNWKAKISKSHNVVLDRYREMAMIEGNIELIYYLIPTPVVFNYPYIMTHWDNGHLSMFSFPEVAMNYTYEEREKYFKGVLGKAFAVFCESQAGKEELVQFTNINKDRVFVAPMFPGAVTQLNLSYEQQNNLLENFGLRSKNFFFYPAQFWSHKNHYNLLLAFEKISASNPHLKLVFTGSDKGNLDYIRGVIKDLQLEEKVLMPGFVEYETLYTFYKNAIALVMPSFLGPTNMPLLEAQSIGCRVICTDLKGHREMMGDDALYIDPTEPSSLAKAMVACLQQNAQISSVSNAEFNIENTMKQVEANLLNLISRRKTFGFNFKQY